MNQFSILELLIVLLGLTTILSRGATGSNEAKPRDTFKENLFIRPLEDGKLFTQFQFKTTYRNSLQNLKWENEFQLFPFSLADLISTSDLNKLHFSLTKGNWNYKSWGYSTRPSPPGAQIRVLFSDRNFNSEKSWQKLVNSLAGLFCSSLISASDKKAVITSKLTFKNDYQHFNSSNHSSKDNDILYVNLPEETLCTENLTPWKKLLPYYTNSGLASLLKAVQLLQSSYSSLAIDIEPIPCHKQAFDNTSQQLGCEQVQLTQTISVVFNPLILFENKQTWSLEKIFGKRITEKSPMTMESCVHVDITDLDDRAKLYPKNYKEHKLLFDTNSAGGTNSQRTYAIYNLNELIDGKIGGDKGINIGVKQTQTFKQRPLTLRPHIPVHFETYIAGSGSKDGTIVASISNKHDKPIRVTYMDVVPYFLKVYFHTLAIRTRSNQELKADKLNFVMSKDSSPSLVEFSVILPPNSDTQISYDFERAFLRWTEFKPDAHKGVLVGSATIDISLCCSALDHLVFPVNTLASNQSSISCLANEEGDVLKMYARPLLVILPTPDFSMPYNVICLVCTVMMVAIGPLYNITTRKPVIEVSKKTLKEMMSKIEKMNDDITLIEDEEEEEDESKKDQ